MSRSQLNTSILVVTVTLMAMLAVRGGGIGQPSPIDAPGLNLLIVEESEASHDLPDGQEDILGSMKWRSEWRAKGGEIRVIDPSDEHPNDLPKWRDAAAKIKAVPLPAYAIGNGTTGEVGTLPLSLAEWDAILAKYGGQP